MFYFDFNGANYQETGTLEKVLINHLHRWEEKYQVTDKSETLSGRFQNILTAVFKGFFSILKNCDEYLQFVFITGVTKFHKVSIFSDLNQLNDISLNKTYSGICGITEEELKQYFAIEMKSLAEEQNISEDECLQQLKFSYDGFGWVSDGFSD